MTRMTSSLLTSGVIQKGGSLASEKATCFEQVPLEVVRKIAEEQAGRLTSAKVARAASKKNKPTKAFDDKNS
jgi:hypothetical protein